jgi:hypothetical protein
VTRLEDPNGNQLEIAWEKVGNTPVPASILYGGNAAASIPHPFRIRFESEDLAAIGRPILRTLSNGVDQQLLRRVRTVIVEAGDCKRPSKSPPLRAQYDDSLDTAEFCSPACPERTCRQASNTRPPFRRSSPTAQPVPDRVLGASMDFGPIPRVDGSEWGWVARSSLREWKRQMACGLR